MKSSFYIPFCLYLLLSNAGYCCADTLYIIISDPSKGLKIDSIRSAYFPGRAIGIKYSFSYEEEEIRKLKSKNKASAAYWKTHYFSFNYSLLSWSEYFQLLSKEETKRKISRDSLIALKQLSETDIANWEMATEILINPIYNELKPPARLQIKNDKLLAGKKFYWSEIDTDIKYKKLEKSIAEAKKIFLVIKNKTGEILIKEVNKTDTSPNL